MTQRLEKEFDGLDANSLPEEAPSLLDQNARFKEEALAPAKRNTVEKKHVPVRKKDSLVSARLQQV